MIPMVLMILLHLSNVVELYKHSVPVNYAVEK